MSIVSEIEALIQLAATYGEIDQDKLVNGLVELKAQVAGDDSDN